MAVQLKLPLPVLITSNDGAVLTAVPPQAGAVKLISIVLGVIPIVGGRVPGDSGRVKVTVSDAEMSLLPEAPI